MSFSKSLRNKVGSNGDKTEEDSVKPQPKLDTENILTYISNDTHDQLRSAFQSFGKHNHFKKDLDKSLKRLPPLVAGKTKLAEDCKREIINTNSTSESIMDGYEIPLTNRSGIPMTSRSGDFQFTSHKLLYREENEDEDEDGGGGGIGNFYEDIDNKLAVVLNYWRQIHDQYVNKNNQNREEDDGSQSCNNVTLDSKQILRIWQDVEKSREVQMKRGTIHKELQFIGKHFRQRKCKVFTEKGSLFKEKLYRCLEKYGIIDEVEIEFCECGLQRSSHCKDAIDNARREQREWSQLTHTEKVLPWNFGNVDMGGNYSYLDLVEGTHKYMRMDDIITQPHDIWRLLTDYWGLRKPNMVISITGGDITALFENPALHKQFREGIIKTAVSTKSWIITEGIHNGSSKEIGEIFQEDLRKSEWSEIEDHTNIPLIGMAPWGVIAGQDSLSGIHMGTKEAKYRFTHSECVDMLGDNTLDPYHTVYLLGDDGTHGRYTREPRIRRRLEGYIAKHTSIEMLGGKGVRTPVVIVVLGGDTFTLQKVSEAIAEDLEIAVVIVGGSGLIANMLAAIYHHLESASPFKNKKNSNEWSEKEEDILTREILKYKEQGLLSQSTSEDENNLRYFMTRRHLIRVFGMDHGDELNLDNAILGAIFGGVTEISTQLDLTLAMDRVTIARETIFIESRKEELQEKGLVDNALFVALEEGKADFTQLLLDQDFGGEFNFTNFLTVRRLHSLHLESLNSSNPMAKVLRSLTKKDVYGNDELKDDNILPQIGRIVYRLMGDNFRLLYQEKEFRDVSDQQLPWNLSRNHREEAIWHIFIWSILANHKEIAELFLFETDCKIGAALVAYKMYMELSKVAEVWHETELTEDLLESASYFENLAIETLDHLYEMNREAAYANLVSVIPFHWGKYATPLTIADDGEAKRFMGHACCQTFLNLLWMQYMDLDTPNWRLIPVFSLVPFLNIPFITFDKENLSFGSFAEGNGEEEKDEKIDEDLSLETHNEIVTSSDPVDTISKTGSKDSICSNNKKTGSSKNLKKRVAFAWFCVKNYYTSPCMKFIHSFASYIVFLGIFSHFVLTELRPLGEGGASEVTVFEWLAYLWVLAMTCQELNQAILQQSSGPLYNLKWTSLEPDWKYTWYWHERLGFVLRLQKIGVFLSDRWNSMDALMISMFITSVVLRFNVKPVDFDIVRAMFCITLILFYMRLLRFGYIARNLGPRIITIRAMFGDLFQFLLILSVFVISFGVAFQALLDPNKPPSWDLVADILWRSYWQMLGELMIDDTEGMGRPIAERNCTSDRQLAQMHPDEYQYCYSWLSFVLLAVYMLLTNILLLNLLIAIFSNSFEKIEANSQLLWRYHLYDLVHEYYQQVWLPPPFNLLCYAVNICLWLLKWPRRLLYLLSLKENNVRHHDNLQNSKEDIDNRDYATRNKDDSCTKSGCSSALYYDYKDQEEELVDHFRQDEFMRDEDLEEMAYKKYMRHHEKAKHKESEIKDLLKMQSTKLKSLTADLSEVKHQKAAEQQSLSEYPQIRSIQVAEPHQYDNTKIEKDVKQLYKMMEHMNGRMDTLVNDIGPILQYVKKKASNQSSKKKSSRVLEVEKAEEDYKIQICRHHEKRDIL